MLGTLDVDELGAWLLGRDARGLVGSRGEAPSRLIPRVLEILDRECDPEGPLRLVGDAEGPLQERRRMLLAAFALGLRESP